MICTVTIFGCRVRVGQIFQSVKLIILKTYSWGGLASSSQTAESLLIPPSQQNHLGKWSENSSKGFIHRHLSNIDCLTAHTACLACFISTVNGCSKKKPIKSGASSGHIRNLKQSLLETFYTNTFIKLKNLTNSDLTIHLRNIDSSTACTACIVSFISTVNGHSKKKRK